MSLASRIADLIGAIKSDINDLGNVTAPAVSSIASRAGLGTLNPNPTFILGENGDDDYAYWMDGSNRKIVKDKVDSTAGAFYIRNASTYGGSWFSENFYPVTVNRQYRATISVASKISGSAVDLAKSYAHYSYLGVVCFDSDKATIRPAYLTDVAGWDAVAKRGKSSTELVQEVKNGDIEIIVADASKWDTGSANHRHALTVHPLRPDGTYGFIGNNGRYYDADKMSRHLMYYGVDKTKIVDNGNGTWTVGLQSPWTLGTFPIGSRIKNSYGGGTYNYWISSYRTELEKDVISPKNWNRYSSPWESWDEQGSYYGDPAHYAGNFRNGIAYCKLLLLPQYGFYVDSVNTSVGTPNIVRESWYSTLSLEWRHTP